MEHLKGLQALLVRPIQPDGHGDEILSAKLIAEGALLHHFPVMKITPLESSLNQDLISHYILNLFLYDRAIFVSRAATFFVVDWLKRNSDLMPQVLPVGPRYYAVGKTTATELKKYNVDAELPECEFSSEGLLGLTSLQRLAGEKILIFSGVGGRQLLPDQLRSRGAVVSQCELYHRKISTDYTRNINDLLYSNKLGVVIIHSGELLAHLVSQIPGEGLNKLKKLPLLVPSERVSLLAKNMGFQYTICAPSALAEDIISVLSGWCSNQR